MLPIDLLFNGMVVWGAKRTGRLNFYHEIIK